MCGPKFEKHWIMIILFWHSYLERWEQYREHQTSAPLFIQENNYWHFNINRCHLYLEWRILWK